MKTLCMYVVPEPQEYQGAVADFITSYTSRDAGADHDLLVLCKGGRTWSGPPAEVREWPDRGFDIGPFQDVCREYGALYERVMLLSTTCILHCDGWLAHYLAAFEDDVAMVSASGSYARGYSQHDFNPHLRTANLMVRPSLINELELPVAVSKRDCWDFEHADWNVTRLLRDAGYRCLVVGRDGRTFDVDDWITSGTFYAGGQANLIASDRQTNFYEHASARQREFMTAAAWRRPVFAGHLGQKGYPPLAA